MHCSGLIALLPAPRRLRLISHQPHRSKYLFIFAVALLAFACLAPEARAAAPTIRELVDQFNATNYLNTVSNKLYTRQGMNRNMVGGTHHDLCRDAIYAEFQNAGLTPYKDAFTYQSNSIIRNACNIIAVKEGVQNPNREVYVVGSHYDSKNNPGADDNATGVACQLEMARILSRYSFAKTIAFCIFDGEEDYDSAGNHRLGSVRFVSQHRTDNIKAMISVDMIGWQAPGVSNNTAALYARTGVAAMDAIRRDFGAALTNYGGLKVLIDSGQGNISDHVAFEDAGFPACLLIEGYYSKNPNYHKSTDYVEMPGYLDWGYLERMCKSVIAWYAEKLQPVDITPDIASITQETNGFIRIRFTGLPGCQYATEWNTNLATASWTSIETNTASPSDGTFTTSHWANGTHAFYRARFVSGDTGNPHSVPDIIIDTPAATAVGSWNTGTMSTDKYGTNYLNKAPGTGSAYVEYRPTILTNGVYSVYEWHPQGPNRTTAAPIEIVCSTGTNTVSVNQQINGGTWVALGKFNFASGTNGYIRIKDNFTGSVVIADAIKLVFAP